MKKYLREAKILIDGIKSSDVEAISREQNQEANILSKYVFTASLWQRYIVSR